MDANNACSAINEFLEQVSMITSSKEENVQVLGSYPFIKLYITVMNIVNELGKLPDHYFPIRIIEEKIEITIKKLELFDEVVDNTKRKVDNIYLNIVAILGIFTAIAFISTSSISIFGNIFDKFDLVCPFILAITFIVVVLAVLMGAIFLLLR